VLHASRKLQNETQFENSVILTCVAYYADTGYQLVLLHVAPVNDRLSPAVTSEELTQTLSLLCCLPAFLDNAVPLRLSVATTNCAKMDQVNILHVEPFDLSTKITKQSL
jgi:hypothetical protein